MSTVSVSLPSDGTTADVTDYNTPINTIVNEINGNLDNDNIKASAGISGSKLANSSIDLGAKASAWDGWIGVSDSWAYASATTVTVPTGAASRYSVGDKVKLTNSTTKYFYITGVADTVLTLNGGSDYTVANSAISAIYFSKVATPLDFPQRFGFTPTLSGRLDEGDWTKSCFFSMQGKRVDYTVNLIATAAAPMGGGVANAMFTLPVTSVAIPGTDGRNSLGAGIITDDSGSTYSAVVGYSTTAIAIIYSWSSTSTLAAITSTAPFTWTTNDEIGLTGWYYAA